MSIVRIGLGETKNFADGYEAIFGKKEKEKAKPKAKPAAKAAKKPVKKAPAKKKKK
jgi:hypothetical protein